MKYKILVVEDEEKLRELLSGNLSRHGFEVFSVSDFTRVEEQFDKVQPHLVMMDVNLPYYNGYYFCRVIRRKSAVPILFLSGRGGSMDQIMGIETGADDYITKPVDPEILLSKIKAVLRRTYGEYSRNNESSALLGGLALDEGTYKLQFKGIAVELTKNEFRLLRELMRNGGKLVSREDLLTALWDDSSFVDDNTLTVNVTRIKAKCAELGLPDLIKTKRGAGYYLERDCLKEDEQDAR